MKILNFAKMSVEAAGKNRFITCYDGKADENFENIDFELNKAGLTAVKRSYANKPYTITTIYEKSK